MQQTDQSYLEAIKFLAFPLQKVLERFPAPKQKSVREICLRVERPLAISCFPDSYFFDREGAVCRLLPQDPLLCTREMFRETIQILTEYSLQSYRKEMNAGYITVKGGHRAGLSGSCVYDRDQILSMSEISSINLRIARQVKGVADSLLQRISVDGIKSTLIAGPPGSGKTTLLKDLARQLAGEAYGYKLSIIDERGEIAAVYRGVPQNDIGILSDVFDGYHKGEGMTMAIRSMSPQIIILDEIATKQDACSVMQGLNAGVCVIATVHAASLDELCRKEFVRRLISQGAFDKLAFLKSAREPCAVQEIVSTKELILC